MPDQSDRAAPPEISAAARAVAERLLRETAVAEGLKPDQAATALAERLGVSQPTVSRFLRGHSGLGWPLLLALSRVSGLSICEVCGLGSGARTLDAWEVARLYLATAATPEGVRLARTRTKGAALTPRECAARILDAERDLSLGPEDDTGILRKQA